MPISLIHLLENILFVSQKPLSALQLARMTDSKEMDVDVALEAMADMYSLDRGGIVLMEREGEYCFATNPQAASVVGKMVKDDTSGDLTRAALETLSVVCYRAPVSRAEIEHIRGVNSLMSLRNLLVRGLIEESGSEADVTYVPSFSLLQGLGVQRASDLPLYTTLSSPDLLASFLDSAKPEQLLGMNTESDHT